MASFHGGNLGLKAGIGLFNLLFVLRLFLFQIGRMLFGESLERLSLFGRRFLFGLSDRFLSAFVDLLHFATVQPLGFLSS